MPREFRAVRSIACSQEAAFDFVADYRNVRKVLDGVTRWQPLGQTSSGAGARFDVEMTAAGLPLGGVLVLDRWRRPEEIGWVSESGLVEQRGGWQFRAEGDRTRVELAITYGPPGAAVGRFLAASLEVLVRRRLEQALARLAEHLERPAEG